ncbi:MAG: hypothetical protein UW69_C0046G0003 [Microgenomates group bacterium GW2011_GWA2_44_7]|nr:MAG: hypothetical protein UW69_C0046G0003 [Microgenomates group bacterium GW2011_GWA2_44_7]KKT78431.1 MAG: hypothetical protein UW73_C0003G0079 [Microgenomates group bacterium GW2011_GWB1_44_8]
MFAESKITLIIHYLALFIILVAGVYGSFWFSGQKEAQLVIIWFMGIGYFIWGTIHHLLHNDLHLKVLLEYFLIAAIGILPVSALLLQR